MAASPVHVLLVEDTFLHARIVQRCLQDDYVLTVEETVEAAYTHLADEPVDLLLVDWSLPGKNGRALVQAVRESDVFGDLPIIMQTGEDREEYVRRALEAGVDDYIAKPIVCSTLQEKVAHLTINGAAGDR